MEELQTHKQTKHTDKQANQATKQSDNNFYFREKTHISTHNQHPKLRKETEIPTTSTKHTHTEKQTNKTLA